MASLLSISYGGPFELDNIKGLGLLHVILVTEEGNLSVMDMIPLPTPK